MFNHDHLSRNLQARLKAMVEILSVLFIFFFFSPRVDRIVGWYNYRYGVTCTHEATPVKHTQRAVITKVCHIEYTHIRARTHTRAGIMFGRGRIAVDEGCPPPPRVVFFRSTLRLNRIKCLRHVNCIIGTWHTIFETEFSVISDLEVWVRLAGKFRCFFILVNWF